MKKQNAGAVIEQAETKESRKAKRITSIAELQAMIDAPMVCAFLLDEQTVEIEVSRMSASTMEMVRELKRKAQPPYLNDRKEYDMLNPVYLAQRDQNERIARSLIVYRHCPAVAAGKPEMTKAGEIHQYVSGLFSELVLELIAAKIQEGGLSLDERTNFI